MNTVKNTDTKYAVCGPASLAEKNVNTINPRVMVMAGLTNLLFVVMQICVTSVTNFT